MHLDMLKDFATNQPKNKLYMFHTRSSRTNQIY